MALRRNQRWRRWKKLRVERVLSVLRDMQWTEDDDMRGCMRGYWEKDRPYDTNSAFFTVPSLIVMRKQFYNRLNERCRALLDEILFGLDVWFRNAVAHASYFYPNKYLGDLVCKWMLSEIMNRVDEDRLVTEHMRKAAAYWIENNGDGESIGWSQLVLWYPEREASLHHLALVRGEQPELTANDLGKIDWNVTCDIPKLHEQRVIAHLWAISLDGPIDAAPEVIEVTEGSVARSKEEGVKEIRWGWSDTLWKVAIDPSSSEPLFEV